MPEHHTARQIALTGSWQDIGHGLEARVLSISDGLRVGPDGKPIDGSIWIPPEVQATQRFVWGALTEFRVKPPEPARSADPLRGTSVNPTPDCGALHQATGKELWFCHACGEFHEPAKENADG